MEPFARRRVELPPEDRFALRTAVERDLPRFEGRLDGVLEFNALAQPFFRDVEILDVQSPVPSPVRMFAAWSKTPRRLWVLSGRIDRLREVVAVERPEGLTDPKVATTYALHADAWTSEAELGELRIASLDEIPWPASLSAKDQALVDQVKLTLGSLVHPQKLLMGVGEYQLEFWVLSNQRLIERRLRVPLSGALEREDRVHADKLPVPRGRVWGMVKGRWVPTG